MKSIRNSDLFETERVETFVKFNYRHCDSNSINYGSVFDQILTKKKGKNRGRIQHGSMHVCELWGEDQMLGIIGHLPLPNDRLKMLDAYKSGKNMK